MKTKEQIEEINARRAQAMEWMENARQVFVETECSLGDSIISNAIREIRNGGMDEY